MTNPLLLLTSHASHTLPSRDPTNTQGPRDPPTLSFNSCAILQDAALAFCEDHGLDKGIAGPLARHIQGNLERANQDALAQVGAT